MEVEPEFRHLRLDEQKTVSLKWVISISLVTVAILIILLLGINPIDSWHKFSDRPVVNSQVLGRLDHEADAMVEHLSKEPCNRNVSGELAEKLLEHEEYGAILDFYKNQTAQCGVRKDMLPIVFKAQMGLSDFATAENTANKVVALYPEDPSAFGWRAEAREQTGNLKGAYEDMKMALSLFSDPSDIALQVYYDTAKLANETGHPCEAITYLRDYIAYDAHERRTQQLDTIMKQWQKVGLCAPLFGSGSARVRFNKQDSAIIVPVEINGVQARMVFDTGATSTLISQELAKRAGIETSSTSTADTANGSMLVSRGRAKTISLGNATLRDAQVYVKDTSDSVLGEGVDGLLGLSFSGNFHVQISDGILELKPLNN